MNSEAVSAVRNNVFSSHRPHRLTVHLNNACNGNADGRACCAAHADLAVIDGLEQAVQEIEIKLPVNVHLRHKRRFPIAAA
jgi:hypothetical protein